jgi:hypothetical protein
MLIRDKVLKHTWRFIMLGALLGRIERTGIPTRGIPGSSFISEAKCLFFNFSGLSSFSQENSCSRLQYGAKTISCWSQIVTPFDAPELKSMQLKRFF